MNYQNGAVRRICANLNRFDELVDSNVPLTKCAVQVDGLLSSESSRDERAQ
jgi:hypothetical protein